MIVAILCGGQGKRLKPLSEGIPKAMVKVNGIPIIEMNINWLKHNGFKTIYLCSGYKHEVLEDYFGDGRKFGVEIIHSPDRMPDMGTATVKQLESEINERFLVVNGDTLTDMDLSKLWSFHKSKKKVATIALTQFPSSKGIVVVKSNLVTKFVEKPILPYWMNAGIYAFEPTIFDYLPERGSIEREIFPKLANKKMLAAYMQKFFIVSIDSIKDLEEAEKALAKRKLY